MSLLKPGQPTSTSTLQPAQEYDVEVNSGGISRGQPVYEGSQIVKAGFIRKVYGILAIQLLFTVAGACTCMFSESIRASVLGTPSMLMVASIAPFGFLLGLYCYKDKHPVNLVLLGGFTLCMTYTVGVVCAAYYEGGYGLIVLQALILTASVFASLTTYVMVTKKDFSWMGGALFSGLIILIIWGFMNSFFDFGLGGRMVFSLVGALIFVGYILSDTSLIIHHFGPDDYIIAAVTLYLDIINLFLYLLELLRMLQGGSSQ